MCGEQSSNSARLFLEGSEFVELVSRSWDPSWSLIQDQTPPKPPTQAIFTMVLGFGACLPTLSDLAHFFPWRSQIRLQPNGCGVVWCIDHLKHVGKRGKMERDRGRTRGPAASAQLARGPMQEPRPNEESSAFSSELATHETRGCGSRRDLP